MQVSLDGVTTRNLTREIAQVNTVDPSCLEAWKLRIGELPHDIGRRYNNSLLTPKDWMSHFRNVLHRALYTKNRREGDHTCRCCGSAIENIQHLATCSIAGKVFDDLADLANVQTRGPTPNTPTLYYELERVKFALFAITPDQKPLQEGWINLHLLVWRYLIYHLVLVETEDAKFQKHEVWQATWHALEKRALARAEHIRTDILRADSRGDEPPDVTSKGSCLAPLASLAGDGSLVWNEELKHKISALATPPRRQR